MERLTLATLLTEAAKICPIFRKMRHFQHAKCWIVSTKREQARTNCRSCCNILVANVPSLRRIVQRRGPLASATCAWRLFVPIPVLS